SWTVDFNKENFIGKSALLKIKRNGYSRKLTGFVMKERGIPRQNYIIVSGDKVIGKVTSGSYSPTLKKNIGLGYIDKNYIISGTTISVVIREKKHRAEVVETPFV
ncbi:MAG: glycine cleavage T C-terminal barrel domain-containing protein, partial [Halanaerobiales bacterium]